MFPSKTYVETTELSIDRHVPYLPKIACYEIGLVQPYDAFAEKMDMSTVHEGDEEKMMCN